MAQLIIAAAGAAIGGALVPGVIGLGITGASAGWTIGSLIGSAFAPGQKSQGPRLNDLSVSSSAYGTPIPYTQGSPRIAGQIVWASTKREIATTTRQGKGGSKSKVTTYTYEVDLLILLTDNVIQGVTRIWSNGKLIWHKSSTADVATMDASDATSTWTRLEIYTGSASQLPDPTYEAAVGTANAPAYRGRGSVFIEGLQLGSSGQIPNLTFELGRTGDHDAGDGLTRFQTLFASASSADVSAFANGSGTNTSGTVTAGQYQVTVDSVSAKGLTYGVDTDLGRPANTAYTFECFFSTNVISAVDSVTGMVYVQLMSSGGWAQLAVNGTGNNVYFEDDINGATYYTGSTNFLASSALHHYAICVETTGEYSVYLDGERIVGPLAGGNVAHSNGSMRLGGIRSGGSSQLQLTFKGVRIRRAVMYSGASFTAPATPLSWGEP